MLTDQWRSLKQEMPRVLHRSIDPQTGKQLKYYYVPTDPSMPRPLNISFRSYSRKVGGNYSMFGEKNPFGLMRIKVFDHIWSWRRCVCALLG